MINSIKYFEESNINILELVRYQKEDEEDMPTAAGAENEILSCEDILKSERKERT